MLPISSVASIQYQFPMRVLQRRVEYWELAILSYWQHFLILPNLFGILGNKLGNTTDAVLVMGESKGGYGCKDCLYRV